MTIRRRALFGVLAALALTSLVGAEDLDVPSLFDSTKASFQEQKYGKCLGDLQILYREVARLRSEQIAGFLPPTPEGWTAETEDTSGETAGLGLFAGGGVAVRRRYVKSEDAGQVDVELLANSPLLAGFAMWAANPAFLPQNIKIVTVKGRKAFFETEGDPKLTFLLTGNTTLLVLTGESGALRADVDALANSIDFDRLEKALQE
jgi:hypothetical protein